MKCCKRCGEEKPLTADHWQRQAKTRDGFKSECKDCSKKAGAAYRDANRETLNRKQAVTTEDDNYRMVEDEQYKVVGIKCLTDGCDNVMDTLIDVTTDRRLPRKMCGMCKAKFEDRPLI
jgi:hypothetical protein